MKKIEKFLCLIMCFSFLLQIVTVTAHATETESFLYAQNFEGTNLKETQSRYTDADGVVYTLPKVEGDGFENFSGNNFGTSLVQDPFDTDNRVFLWKRYTSSKYEPANNDENCYIRMRNETVQKPEGSYLDISFRLYLPRQPQSNQIQIRLGGNTTWARTAELTFCSTESDGMTCSVRGRKENYTNNNYWRDLSLTDVADLNHDGWNQIRVISDYNEHKSHLLINEKLVCADIPHGNNTATGLIGLYLISSADTIPTTAYFDDIAISDITEQGIANALFEGAEACLANLCYKPNADSFDSYFSNQRSLPASAALSTQTTSFTWGDFVSGKPYYESSAGSTGRKADLRITAPGDPANTAAVFSVVHGYAPRYYSNNFKSDGTHIVTPHVTVGSISITRAAKHEIRVLRQLLETSDPKIEIGVPNIVGGYWMTPDCSVKEVNVPEVLTAAREGTATHIWQNIRMKNSDSRARIILLGVLFYQNGRLLEDGRLTRFQTATVQPGDEYQWSPNISKNYIPYESLEELTIKFLAIDMETCQPLLPGTPTIGLTENVSCSLNASKTKLTISGKGELKALYAFSDAEWAAQAETVKEIEIGSGITTIGANTLSGFTALECIRLPETLTTIEGGALPANNLYTVIGYQNSPSEQYAEKQGNPFRINGLRILSIGNSHTADYSAFRNDIRNDLKNAGLKTNIEMASIVYGGRKLYTTDTVSTNPPHLHAIQSGSYDYQLMGKSWDLIILQDWHESARKDAGFTEGLASVIRAIRVKQPHAAIAWVMDWADTSMVNDGYGADLNAVYQNITEVAAQVEQMTDDEPDYIIPMGTAIQNARSSYLGSTNNAYGCYINAADVDYDKQTLHTRSLLERDSTHMSLELGRYLAGAAVFQKLLQIYDTRLDRESGFDFAAALKTVPDSAKSPGKAAWEGEFTDNIWHIVTESVQNATAQPKTLTQSIYTVDPALEICAAIEVAGDSMTWSTASAEEIVCAVKALPVVPTDVHITANDVELSAEACRITFLYGYTKLTATVPIV